MQSKCCVVFLHLDCTFIMPQGGLHIIQHYHILYRMTYESIFLLYCSIGNRPPKNDIPFFVLQAQEVHMLCRIGSHQTGGQSNTKWLQVLWQDVLPERILCRNQVTHSQSEQVCTLSALQSLGNPVSNMQRAAVIQTALSSCLNYATVASVLGETEERKGQKWHRASFWLEV